jgi:hypothetical protein
VFIGSFENNGESFKIKYISGGGEEEREKERS